MYIKYASALLFVASLASAAPTPSLATSASNSTARQFNNFTTSAGTGGTGLTQAIATFPGNPGTLPSSTIAAYNVEAHCAVLAEAAFDTAISGAKDQATKDALNVGKIKNKILKIYGTLQVVQGFMLHPSANLTASITSMQELEVKLAKNNAIDTLSKGKPSLGVKFTCPSN